MFAPMSELPILKQASDALKPHEPKLLDVFSKVFKRKRPPQTMRSLAPLAMVFLLEAFGLAFLLDRATVRLALAACRGPGKDSEEDDLLDDSDDMAAIRWAAQRQESLDRAYRALAREHHGPHSMGCKECPTLSKYIKNGHAPDRVAFERQWGERDPIDPSTAPKCFDPFAQLSILDAVGRGDGYLGAFVSNIMLRSNATKSITLFGQTLDLADVETLDEVASRAVMAGWIAYLDHRGAVVGLRLIPRTDGIQTRLRAPLANIVSMMNEPLSDRDAEIEIETLKTKLSIAEDNHRNVCDQRNTILERLTAECDARDALLTRDKQWQDATGASDPEMARELTAQRVEQIKSFDDRAVVTTHADGHTTIVVDESDVDTSASKVEISGVESPGIWRMVWPDKDAAPAPSACANTIVAHRRGEFAELEFPASATIFVQVRAWLGYYQFGICAPSFDSSKYGHCAIGANGEIPPSWPSMKEAKRNAYPGFVLFAPDGSARPAG